MRKVGSVSRFVVFGAAILVCSVSSDVALAGVDVRVNQDVGPQQQQEVDIAVDPSNSNNLVAVYIEFPGFSVGVSISNDGGVTWSDTQLSRDCDGIDNDFPPDGLIDEELCNGQDDDFPPDGSIDEDICCRVGCDGFDNDFDGRIDEEILDGVDNDGDGFTDFADGDVCSGLLHIDPAVTIDSMGNISVIAVTYEPFATSFADSAYVAVWRSTNGGVSWTLLPDPAASVYNNGTPIPPAGPPVPFLDKSWIVADLSGGLCGGHVYAAWQEESPALAADTRILVNKYDPTMGTWSGAVRVDSTVNVCAGSVTPVVASDGTINAIWRRNPAITGCAGPPLNPLQTTFQVDSSMCPEPGPAFTWTWQTPDLAGQTYDQIASMLPGANRSPAYNTSDFPIIEVHPLNPAVLFAVYTHDPTPMTPGDDADVMFTTSPSGGNFWLPPIKINDDATTFGQYWAAISAQPHPSGSAVVDVVWGDERNTIGCDGIDQDMDGMIDEERVNGLDDDVPPDGLIDEDPCERLLDTYWARWVEGAAAFTTNQRISDVSSPVPLSSPVRSPGFGFLGDYIGIASVAGKDFIAWNDTRNVDNDIYFDTMGDFDSDGDGVLDLSDCLPGDAATWAKPGVIQNVRVAKVVASTDVTLSWTSQDPGTGSATGYDVVTGEISDLRSDMNFSQGTCLVDQHPDTPYTDTQGNPPSGDGHYFLIRATNVCGSGSYGHTSMVDPRFALDGNSPCVLL